MGQSIAAGDKGNRNDCRVFQRVAGAIKQRLLEVGLELEKHTLVFDRGNNSKKNLQMVKKLGFHYVGALTPFQHRRLIQDAKEQFESITVDGNPLHVFRERREIWGESRTVIFYLSEKLKEGQLRGLQQILNKKIDKLNQLQETLTHAKPSKCNQSELETRISGLVKGRFLKRVIEWSLTPQPDGRFHLDYSINFDELTNVIVLRFSRKWNIRGCCK